MERASGILLHIATLPGKYGIGQMGAEARNFIDFLASAGQKYWQVLPLVPTGYGDSPYQSCCSYAGNEFFIDIESLTRRGLLTEKETMGQETQSASRIDYEQLFYNVIPLLKKAFYRFDRTDKNFTRFVESGEYSDYSTFRAIKQHFNHVAWSEWPHGYRFRDDKVISAFVKEHAEDLLFWQWCQFEFFAEWEALKEYAHSRGVKIIGDMPIYVACDSVECWAHPELLQLDENRLPTAVAGCPPDYFSAEGQLWGNPLYNWDVMKADGYKWWIERLKKCLQQFDIVRIDHFRGFDRYYSVPATEKSAKNGKWMQGPSSEMFEEIERTMGKMPVIGEDLGILDDSARAMFDRVGYPGMKILEYAFDNPDNGYLPHNYSTDNCVVYPGTHDNDTLIGFIDGLTWQERSELRAAVLTEYATLGLSAEIENNDSLRAAIVRLGYESKTKLVIVQLQDFMGVGREGRINEPSTLSTLNWSYRIPEKYNDSTLAAGIRKLTESTGR